MKRHHLSFADWTRDEYSVILRCLLRASFSQGNYPARLSDRLAHYYAPSSIYLCNYGHHAIRIALTIFQRRQPTRTKVLVPAYICPSVIQAVESCGLTAISVDINDDLNLCPTAVQCALDRSTLAVIAPHMYGAPAKISDIEKLCNTAGIFLIDDAAQVVSVRSEGRLLGTFGDAGIISFAQSKTIVTGIRGSGGVLLINNPEYDVEAKQAWQMLPPSTNRLEALCDFLWNYVWSARTGNSGYYLSRLCNALGWHSQTTSACTQISNLEAGIGLAQFERIEMITQEKIRIAHAYHVALQQYPLIQFPQYATERFLTRVMLRLPEHVDIPRLRTTLKATGIETRTGYKAYLSPGTIATNAENLSHRLLEVPCRRGMSEAEIGDICSVVSHQITSQTKP